MAVDGDIVIWTPEQYSDRQCPAEFGNYETKEINDLLYISQHQLENKLVWQPFCQEHTYNDGNIKYLRESNDAHHHLRKHCNLGGAEFIPTSTCEHLNPPDHLTRFHKVKRCLNEHVDLLNDEGLIGLADRFSSGAIRAVGVTYMRSGGFRPLWNYYPGETRLNWQNQSLEVAFQEPP